MTEQNQWETIPEIVRTARERLPQHVWDYSCGGAESEVTLRRNRTAFEHLAFRSRVLRDVSTRDTGTEFLGIPLSMPVMLAPIGSMSLFDPEGALAAARAAHHAGTASFVGTLASPSLEEVSSGSDGPLFFQLYVNGDRPSTRDLVRRAEDAGYRGICLTVDSAVYGRRERDIHNRFRPRDRDKPNVPDVVDPDARRSGDVHRAASTWQDLEWLCSTSELPVLVKGIMCAEDALLAAEHDVAAVYVSNHGGRQLDHNAATLEVLPEVVEAVAGRAEILVDGGFLRGTDVLKALALGARAVLVGKLMAWGLAAGGVPALVRTLELLRLEMYVAMASVGVRSVSDLTPDYLRRSTPPLPNPWPTGL